MVIMRQELPEEFERTLELIPVPLVLWQLLDKNDLNSLVSLSMNTRARSLLNCEPISIMGTSHATLLPHAPSPAHFEKYKTSVNGEPISFKSRYSQMGESEYEVQIFRVHSTRLIVCEFFWRRDTPLTLAGFNTLQFCKSAISFILNQKSRHRDFWYLSTVIGNILGHIENFSLNLKSEPGSNQEYGMLDFNTMIRRLALGEEQNMEYVDMFLRSFPFVGLKGEYVMMRLLLRFVVAASENYFLHNEAPTTLSPNTTPSSSPSSPPPITITTITATRTIVQLRVVNVLKRWMTKYPYYFEREPELEEIIDSFISYTESCEDLDSRIHDSWRNALRGCLKELRETSLKKKSKEQDQRGPNNASGISTGKVGLQILLFQSVIDLIKTRGQTPEEFGKALAKQLTLEALHRYKALHLLDLYTKLYSKSADKGDDQKQTPTDLCPNFTALIDHSNRVSRWIASEICRQNDLQLRAEILECFIEAAYAALSWHDFETCFSITAGLCSHPVDRLSITWGKLFHSKTPSSFRKIFKRTSKGSGIEVKWNQLQKVVNVNRNYTEYRARLVELLHSPSSQGIKPAIPAFQVLLKDLTFIDENVNKKSSSMLNLKANYSSLRQITLPDGNMMLSESYFTPTEDSELTFESTTGSFDSSSEGSLDSYRENVFEHSNQNLLDALSLFQKTDSINYFKLNQIANTLNYFEHFKLSLYDFPPEPQISNYFSQASVLLEDELYSLSYKIHPRSPSTRSLDQSSVPFF